MIQDQTETGAEADELTDVTGDEWQSVAMPRRQDWICASCHAQVSGAHRKCRECGSWKRKGVTARPTPTIWKRIRLIVAKCFNTLAPKKRGRK